MPLLFHILVACIAGSLLSLAIASIVAFRVQARWIPTLVSYAVGALLGAVFLDLLPHVFEDTRNPARVAAFILFGILAFFVLEKLLLWRHHHHGGEIEEAGHAHEGHGHDTGRSGWMIVIGDSFHNFTDGVIIASAFIADLRLGVVTAIAIIAHEIPQEIGDFLVLLHSGFGKAKALAMNALSGLATVAGALLAYFALATVSAWIPEILAIASASMIYVAVADLIPGLHKRTAIRETLVQVAFIALGIASIWLIHAALVPEP
ncbi:MAG TPA: ZIP family metal transporter [Usitatibacter sp.]|nr:ZIP family metal transporter [Usitatibacter sp.]